MTTGEVKKHQKKNNSLSSRIKVPDAQVTLNKRCNENCVFKSMHRRTFMQAAMSYLIRDKFNLLDLDINEKYRGIIVNYKELAEKTLKESGIIRERHFRAGPMLRKGQGSHTSRGSLHCTLNSSFKKNGSISKHE